MNEIKYKVVNGTSYDEGTPDAVVKVIEHARQTNARVRLFLGDAITGKCWMDEYDVCGRIGRSMGPVKVPILLANTNIMGGGELLSHCIIRILVNGHEAYRHEKFNMPELVTGEPPAFIKKVGHVVGIYADGNNIANFKTRKSADRWVKFMNGERMCK